MSSVGLVFPAAHRRGGIERVVWETARHFAPRHATTFVGSSFAPTFNDGPLHFRRVAADGQPAGPARFRRMAARLLATTSLDVTITYGANCPVGDVLAVGSVHKAWLDRGHAVKVRGVTVPNAARRALPRHQTLLRLEKAYFTAERPHAVLALTEQVANDLQHYYDVPRSKIHIVPNGYASDEFSADRAAERRDGVRADLGLGDSDVAVLMVANELHRKGFETLVRALNRLDDPRISLHVVGRMPLDTYAALIGQLGLTTRVRWHGQTDDVARYMAAADLFVLPTQYEPFGLVIIEALATGLPVVTTALAGAASVIQPGVNGLLQTDPLDDLELAKLISESLTTGTLDRWRAAAPASVAEYEWTPILERVEGIALGR